MDAPENLLYVTGPFMAAGMGALSKGSCISCEVGVAATVLPDPVCSSFFPAVIIRGGFRPSLSRCGFEGGGSVLSEGLAAVTASGIAEKGHSHVTWGVSTMGCADGAFTCRSGVKTGLTVTAGACTMMGGRGRCVANFREKRMRTQTMAPPTVRPKRIHSQRGKPLRTSLTKSRIFCLRVRTSDWPKGSSGGGGESGRGASGKGAGGEGWLGAVSGAGAPPKAAGATSLAGRATLLD